MNDDKHAVSQALDQQHISQLYVGLSKDQPSKEVDDTIIRQAQAQIECEQTTGKASRRHWRKWQWPASIAASVIFVSVIFFTQYRDFGANQVGPTSLPADPYAIADQATLDESAARERAVLETKAQGIQRQVLGQDQPPQSIAEEFALVRKHPEKATSQISEPQKSNYAEQEAQGLAAKALKDVELDINIDEFQLEELTSLPASSQDQDVKSNMQASDSAPRSHTAVTDTATTEARALQLAQSSYLLRVADKLKQLQQLSSPDEQQRIKMTSLQNDLVDYLLLVQSANSDIQIDHEYLDLLTPEQAQRLASKRKK